MANRKPTAARPAVQATAAQRAADHDPKDMMILQLQNRLADMEVRMNALSTAGTLDLLPPEEMSVFEVGPGGYYSADDQLFVEGVQIEDVTGRMPLNEGLIPLNDCAAERMELYLRSLPQHGTPSHEFVLEAAFQRLGDLSGSTEDRAKFFAGVLEEAAHMRMTKLGLMPGASQTSPRAAQRSGTAPMMPNTRIRHDATPLGHLPPAPLARGPAQTRIRAPAAAPALKSAPPMGSVHTTNLGRAGTGATAG